MKLYRKLLAMAMAAAMVFALAACSSSSADTSESTAEDTDTTSDTSSETATETEDTSEESSDGVTVVRIGISNDSMPNCYLDEDGNLAGENYEVMCLVDELLEDYEFEYEPLTQDVILTGMDTGTYDVGVFNAFYSDERAEKYLFPEYPVSGGVRGLILSSDTTITSGTCEEVLDQFAALGLTMVPVSPGDSSDSTFSAYNETHDPKINYEATEEIDVSTSIRYIMQGRYDGAQFLMSNYTAVVDEIDPDGETTFVTFTDGGFGTWVLYAQGQEELVTAVDGAMEQLFADGTMAALSEKYYGENVFQYIEDFEYADVEPNADYE